MKQHTELIKVMDLARSIAGSDYKIARLIGATPQTVSNWRTCTKPCPPADVALMAAIGGLDPAEWLTRATLWKYEGTKKGDRLLKILGKASGAIIAVAASSTANAAQIFSIDLSQAAHTLQLLLVQCSTMYRTVKL